MDAAAEIGAKGLIVHGGHVTDDDDPAKGYDNWRKAVEASDLKIPLLIENTAGGTNAMTRYLDGSPACGRHLHGRGLRQVGFCLDTCHAHAGGHALETVVDDVLKITGRIDLVHCNDSRDDFDSEQTGTPTSAQARSTRICSPRWSATRALRWSARRRAGLPSTLPTSTGCAHGCSPR